MNTSHCRIVIWNVAWRRRESRAGSELRARMDAQSPGVIEGVQRHAIDHLAHTRDLAPISVRGLSNIGSNGK